MLPLANAGIIWLVTAVLYLLAPVGWDHLAAWARRWKGWPRRWLSTLRRKPQGIWLRTTGRILYCLGIPYAALLLGVADARRLGLAGLAWWPHLPLGTLVGLVGVLFLVWSWGRSSGAMYRRGSRHRLLFAEWQAFRRPWGWAHLAFEVIYLQVSWAFVRGAAVWLLDLYAGVFVGLALVAAAWLLRPGSPASLAEPERRAQGLLTAGLAVLTALVFLYSESLWLSAAVQALGLLGATLAAGRAYARAAV